MAWDLNSHRSLLLEANAHIPIIEVQLSVHDRPAEVPPVVAEAADQNSIDPIAIMPAAQPISNTAVLLRFNWAIALLVVIILVLLIK